MRKEKRNLNLREKEKLSILIKHMEIVRETPVGKEKMFSCEDVRIPLIPSEEMVVKRPGRRKISPSIVRDYVNLDFKKELSELEEKSRKVIYERGIFERLVGLRGRKKIIRGTEVRDYVLENLRSTRPFPKDIGVVALAFYLKEFFQVIFDVKEELTYEEMAELIKTKAIEEGLRKELSEFFSAVAEQVYSGYITLDYAKSYELAKRAVEEFLK